MGKKELKCLEEFKRNSLRDKKRPLLIEFFITF